ncbi:hypothetical protein PG985_003183 [Apiospora marii]|uniref:Protein kinase domain-containing protein n=1 Tax=Apiospora marii TaxID=335849 RepID=A0ABR1RUX3_9PEZI
MTWQAEAASVSRIRVRDKLPGADGQGGTRRLAVKRAMEGEEEVLRNEVRWLKGLGGSEHIVRIVASHDDVRKQGTVVRWARRLSSRGSEADVWSSLVGLRGALRLGGLQQGAVVGIALSRACLHRHGESWNADGNANPRLEEIPDDGTRPSHLDHGDLHLGNVMIGDVRTSSGNEHELVPVLKLIDFGQAKKNEHAVQETLFKISKVSFHTIPYPPGILFPFNTDPESPDRDCKYVSLDPQLRDLLAWRCLAQDPGERPGLAEMLRVVQAAAVGVVRSHGGGASSSVFIIAR